MMHHHEERSVAGLTLTGVLRLMIAERIPPDAVFDTADSDTLMIPGIDESSEKMISVPVLSWRVDDDSF